MSQVPANLRYRESHEWIDPATGTVGITDHAQAELSDVVYVELPKVGAQVKAGDQVAVVESVKAASDIYSPVDGEVIEVNSGLPDNPALLNADPYAGGWIFKLKVANAASTDSLLDAAAYQQHIA
ncbi:glycine cleavage system H protein [Roseimicrobium gellanilyticum]|uniref:Glycine cleavage system H protein n=1 Tax=Roseimicrobium gellanilyticum TaxID=748857 RepID=A0A366HHY8_9BACT|nr:glycine cleavage system protein GcvH [Roseimicrobium gellanilyticum]RBP42331.1 glycine cleavage system H protein [Roseimicrobium gellanilyticum]